MQLRSTIILVPISIIRWFLSLTIWFLAVVTGPIGYFLAKYTKLSIFVNIWGNSVDGYCGDAPYQAKEAKFWLRRPWPCFWWSVIRNPANNLARRLAPKFKVESMNIPHTNGGEIESNPANPIFIIVESTTSSIPYWFFYTPRWPVMFKFGYKLWPDSLRVGSVVHPKLAFSIQRGNKG